MGQRASTALVEWFDRHLAQSASTKEAGAAQ
jgi:hypothetical protein